MPHPLVCPGYGDGIMLMGFVIGIALGMALVLAYQEYTDHQRRMRRYEETH